MQEGSRESIYIFAYNRGLAARSANGNLSHFYSGGVDMTDACNVWKSSTALSSA